MQLKHCFDLVYLSALKVRKKKVMDFRCRSKKKKKRKKMELSVMGMQTSVASHLPLVLLKRTHLFCNKKRQKVV